MREAKKDGGDTVQEVMPLRLSMQIISDYLDDEFSDHIFYRNHDAMILDDVRLYRGQKALQERYVYLVAPQELEEAAQYDSALIVVGPAELTPQIANRKGPILHMPNKRELLEVLEEIQDVFDRFRRWSSQMNQILSRRGTMFDYCTSFTKIIGNPIWVLNRSNDAYLCTSHIAGMLKMIPDPESGMMILPSERKNLLYHTKEFIETYGTQGAHYWFPPWNKHRDIYINITDEEEHFLGRILVIEMQTPLCSSHLQLLEYFAPFIREAFKGVKKPLESKSELQAQLERILRQDYESKEEILDKLARLGWTEANAYIVAAAPIHSLDPTYALSVCLDLADNIPDSTAFLFDGELVVVCRLPELSTDPGSYYGLIHEIGLKDNIHFGASDPFFNPLRLPDYQKQAHCAREIGMRADTKTHVHPYAKNALAYLLTNAVGALPLSVACSGALRTLKKIDREKGSEYLNTLREYIKANCQPVQAAKELFLHRGTLSYRLKKICGYTNLDLEDADTILYLNLSFRMIDLLKEEKTP